jgi:hypothetical protein
LIDLLAEEYGLITGPQALRPSLMTKFDGLGFKRHPLAPCVVLKYDKEELCGLIVIETDDLLGGGITESCHQAVAELRKHSLVENGSSCSQQHASTEDAL